MKLKLFIPCLLGIFFVLSCGTKVNVGTTDSDYAKVVMLVAQNGRSASVKSEQVNGKTLQVRSDRQAVVLASGGDSLGMKSLTVEVTNGSIEVDGRLSRSFTERSEIDSLNQALRGLFIAGVIHPDSPQLDVIVKAEGKDHAGNVSLTPSVTLIFEEAVDARLSADRSVISRGESVNLHWESDNADEVRLNNLILSTFDGNQTVTPNRSESYILEAENSVSVDRDTVIVTVDQPPNMPRIVRFEASPATINQGNSSTLSWDVQDANSISLNSVNVSSGQNSKTVNPSSTKTYRLRASNSTGFVDETETVRVDPPVNSIECMTVPTSVVSFSYLGFSQGKHVYSMNLSGFSSYNNKPITKVTNNSGYELGLFNGNTSKVLRLNQSTDAFDNLNFASTWLAQSRIYIPGLGPKIEFCYDNN